MKVGTELVADSTRIQVVDLREGPAGAEVQIEYAGHHAGVRSERWYPVSWLLETGWVVVNRGEKG
jgi:hypothetical protein